MIEFHALFQYAPCIVKSHSKDESNWSGYPAGSHAVTIIIVNTHSISAWLLNMSHATVISVQCMHKTAHDDEICTEAIYRVAKCTVRNNLA